MTWKLVYLLLVLACLAMAVVSVFDNVQAAIYFLLMGVLFSQIDAMLDRYHDDR